MAIVATLAYNCEILNRVAFFSCTKAEALLMVDVIVTLCDLFVALEALVLLLLQEALVLFSSYVSLPSPSTASLGTNLVRSLHPVTT